MHCKTMIHTSFVGKMKKTMRLNASMFGRKRNTNIAEAACDVFLNHRRVDTKRTVVRLLYHHLVKQGVNPFLDTHNMKPGDRLLDNIEKAVLGCKVGVAVFSPRYCDSYFCLHELSLMVESKKRIVPIFYDVKPSQLQVKDNAYCSEMEMCRFSLALQEAKYIVGLSYDSSKGDWSELVLKASDAIMKNLNELEKEKSA